MRHASQLVRSLFTALLCAALFLTSSLSYVPPAAALAMNPAGDYVQGESPQRVYPRWQVVDTDPQGLNCRALDSKGGALNVDLPLNQRDIANWPVVKTFPLGAELRGVNGRKGNLPVQIEDNQGKSWIAISPDNRGAQCVVRANSKYVRPLLTFGSQGWRCSCRGKDCGSREHPNSFTVEKTENLDPSSPDYSCALILPEIPSVPDLEKIYQPFLKDLQMTGIPLRLPTYIPATVQLFMRSADPKLPATDPQAPTIPKQVYSTSPVQTPDIYSVAFSYHEGCTSGSMCDFSYFLGQRLTKETRSIDEQYASKVDFQASSRSPEPLASVVLSKGIKGKFVPWDCGVNCTSAFAFVVWDEGGYRYTVSRKFGDQAELMRMANSAIDSQIGRPKG
jgi:hypothetical protein